MTTLYHESDASLDAVRGQHVAVVGYGNQGRCWALNLRDSGVRVSVHVRRDATREQAEADGFEADDIAAAGSADIVCILVPDDIIPDLPIAFRDDALVIVASGYSVFYGRFAPACDVGLIAPRQLGPEVRETYVEGIGFMSAIGVHQDVTGTARERLLGVALALGALGQGAIEMSMRQEAVLDLAVEQVLAPALRKMNLGFTQVMLENDVPMEAILAELFMSGEVERTMRRLRTEGYAGQLEHHSPTSQYGQLSRADRFDDVDVLTSMRETVAAIVDGRFADEWDAERATGYATLTELKKIHAGPEVAAWEAQLRTQLGEGAKHHPPIGG